MNGLGRSGDLAYGPGIDMIAATKNQRRPEGLVVLNRKWIVRAILGSLLLHGLLILVLQRTELTRYGDPYFERIVPRSFKLERVEIDPRLLDPASEIDPAEIPEPRQTAAIELPREPADFSELMADVRVVPEAAPQDMVRPLLDEKPAVDSEVLQNALERAGESARAARELDVADLAARALEESAAPGDRPLLEFTLPSPGARLGDSAAERVAGGFTDLDALLAQSGPVENQPILMDSNLLFDYDDFRLRPEAVGGLEKIGQLIARTPGARLVIEGHSDTFGPDEYNLDLSRRRAESVREWMISFLGMRPEHISTLGYGNTRALIPEGTIEEQQINRRVEIIIRRQALAP